MSKHSHRVVVLCSLIHFSIPAAAAVDEATRIESGAANDDAETDGNDETDGGDATDRPEQSTDAATSQERAKVPNPAPDPPHSTDNEVSAPRKERFAASTASVSENHAEEDDDDQEDYPSFGAEAQVDLINRMVWRGLAFTRNAILAPSASILLYGFTAEYWSGYALTNELNGRHLAAIVPSLSYEATLGHLYASPGVIYYAVSPDGLKSTLEASIEAGYKVGDFRFFSEDMLDVAGYRGAYFGFLGARYVRRIRHNLQVEARLDVGFANAKFNQTYLGEDRGALNLVGLSGSLRYNITDLLYLLPQLELTSLVTFRYRVEQPTLLVGSCGLGVEL